MEKEGNILYQFYNTWIRWSYFEAKVPDMKICIGFWVHGPLKNNRKSAKYPIYIKSRSLKHVYDKRTAEEFDFILGNYGLLLADPDKIYRNKDQKRGDYCFVRRLEDGREYFCSLELECDLYKKISNLWLVTVFRIRKVSYLHNYKLLWTRGSDISPS